jgi:hypothetical protein
LRFVQGSVTAIPLAEASVDLIVSFETIEHLSADDQPLMLAEFARVLAPDGLLLLSSPNRPEYSESRDYRNPFHLHELSRDELAKLLDAGFPARAWYRQRMWMGSTLWAEGVDGGHEAWNGDARSVLPASPPKAMYFVVVCARDASVLPSSVAVSLFADEAETELKRALGYAAEAMRLDGLALQHLADVDRQSLHIADLERRIAECEAARVALVTEATALATEATARKAEAATLTSTVSTLNARIATLESEAAMLRSNVAALEADLSEARRERDHNVAECERLERVIATQERVLSHAQSLRGWLGLPWRRAKLFMHKLRGA